MDRLLQDAHNCCHDFDPENKTALFAVYDGHGGKRPLQLLSLVRFSNVHVVMFAAVVYNFLLGARFSGYPRCMC